MKVIIAKLAQIAELESALYDMQHSNATEFIAKHGDSVTFTGCKEKISNIKAELKSMMYSADDGIIDNLFDCMRRNRYVSEQDILNATKLCDTDVVYAVKIKTMSKDGKQHTQIFRIYMDEDYTNRDDSYKQDVINTVWGITAFFGQMLTDILECKKVECGISESASVR